MIHTQNRLLFLFLVPALLMLLVFTVLPSLWAIYISFTDLALAGPKAMDYTFVGLKNYVKLFTDQQLSPFALVVNPVHDPDQHRAVYAGIVGGADSEPAQAAWTGHLCWPSLSCPWSSPASPRP